MKILFYGDSITDMSRSRPELDSCPTKVCGMGYARDIAGDLIYENPTKYTFVNRGISGNRVVNLYERIKPDCWAHEPDVLSILIGVNDVWHEVLETPNGVEIDRWEEMYRIIIKETIKRFPNIKIMIMEPFVEKGSATIDNWEWFGQVYDYAKVARKIAKDFNCSFVPLQEKLDEACKKYGVETVLYDGVHPNFYGGKVIAEEWEKVFKEEIDK